VAEGRPRGLIDEHAAKSVIEIEGPGEALKSYIREHNVRHDDLGGRMYYQKTFDGILATPVSLEEIIIAGSSGSLQGRGGGGRDAGRAHSHGLRRLPGRADVHSPGLCRHLCVNPYIFYLCDTHHRHCTVVD
jgi:hypothetical protein